MIIDTTTREHEGLTYTVETWIDEDVESPRDWDNLAYFYIYRPWDNGAVSTTAVDVDELTDDVADPSAGDALRHFIEVTDNEESVKRRFALWQALDAPNRAMWRLFSGSGTGYSQGDYHDYWALINTGPLEGYDPAQIVRDEADAYSTWRYGGVKGVTVLLNGEFIESLGGLYSDEAIDDFVTETVESHAESLADEANRVGAGFVGVI